MREVHSFDGNWLGSQARSIKPPQRLRGVSRPVRILFFVFLFLMIVRVYVAGIGLHRIAGSLIVLVVFLSIQHRRRLRSLVDNFVVAIIILLASGVVGSLSFGVMQFPETSKMIMNLILLMVTAELTTSTRDLRLVLLAVCLGGLFVVASGYVMPAGEGARVVGLTGNANGYGQVCARTLLILVGLAVLFRSRQVRLVLFALAVPSLFGLFYSASRGASVALVCGILTLVTMKSMRKAGIAIALIAAVAFIWFAPAMFSERFSQGFRQRHNRQNALQRRLELNRNGVEVFKRHPVFGVGPGNVRQGMILAEIKRAQVTHNVFIQCLAEGGVIGFSCFFFVLGLTAVGLLRVARMSGADRELRIISATFLAVFVVLVVGGSSSGNYVHSIWYIFFGVIKNMEMLVRKSRRGGVGGCEQRVLGGFEQGQTNDD